MEMKEIKKAMLQERVRISKHALESMQKRGYSKRDLIACIWTGEVTSHQFHRNSMRATVEGKDTDRLPIVVIVGRDHQDLSRLAIITVFPPIKKRFKRVV